MKGEKLGNPIMCLNKVGANVIHESEGRGDRLPPEEGRQGSEHGFHFRAGETLETLLSHHPLYKRPCRRTHSF